MSSFTTQTAEGFAQVLAAGSGGFTWQSSGVYAAGDTGIYVEKVPQAPDRVVVLSVTWLTADPTLSDSTGNLQVRTRSSGDPSDPRDVYAMDDAIQDTLLGRYPLTLPGGVRVSKVRYLSGGSLGLDDNQRPQRSSNLQFVAYRPGTYRL